MENRKKSIGLETRSVSMMIKRHIDAHCSSRTNDRLTGIQGMLLGYIYHHRDSDIYQRDLEIKFDFKRSTATKILQLLEKGGYITRETSDSDARLKRIILTPRGMAFNEEVTREIDAIEEGIDALLTDDERKMFFELCDKIKSGLANTDGGNL